MGFFRDISDSLGFTKQDPGNVSPEAYSQFYDQAMKDLYGIGSDPQSQQLRQGLMSATQGQLDDLANQSAGRKSNFLQDMSEAFRPIRRT